MGKFCPVIYAKVDEHGILRNLVYPGDHTRQGFLIVFGEGHARRLRIFDCVQDEYGVYESPLENALVEIAKNRGNLKKERIHMINIFQQDEEFQSAVEYFSVQPDLKGELAPNYASVLEKGASEAI